jgi:hypothetical protein
VIANKRPSNSVANTQVALYTTLHAHQRGCDFHHQSDGGDRACSWVLKRMANIFAHPPEVGGYEIKAG